MDYDELNSNLGSYSPFFLRIKVLELIDDYKSFEDVAFFHEYMHHLQCVSTIIGLSHLNSLVCLWHSIRNIVQDNDDLASKEQFYIAARNLKYHEVNNKLPRIKSDITISSIEDFSEQEPTQEPVKLKALLGGEELNINFGILEFFESLAYILECLFSRKIDVKDVGYFSPATIPYKLGLSIGYFLNKNYSKSNLAMIMLTAIQHPCPHREFILLARNLAACDISDDILEEKLSDASNVLITQQTEWISSVKLEVYNGFPCDDPLFGNIIKSLFQISISNIDKRKVTPFDELRFIGAINSKEDYLLMRDDFIKSWGGCMSVTESSTGDTRRGNIGTQDSIFSNTRAWEVFQTTIHYIKLYFDIHSESVSYSLQENLKSKCPLFCYCSHGNKVNNPNICANNPWSHPTPNDDESDCPYQLAVYKTDLKNFSC